MIRYTAECLTAANGHWLTGKPEKPYGPNSPKTIRIFESSFLEVFSRSHPITPGIWFGPFVLVILAYSPRQIGVATFAGLFVVGVLFFSLFEYVLHRVIFHGLMRLAAKDERFRFMAFMAHGYHHDFPNDRTRLVMPPMISWPIGLGFAVVYYLMFGRALSLPVLAGTMVGYVAYDWIHFYTHHFRPKWRLGKWLRAYHLRHHFQDHDKFYGISSPLWDIVFGTYRSPLPVRREDIT